MKKIILRNIFSRLVICSIILLGVSSKQSNASNVSQFISKQLHKIEHHVKFTRSWFKNFFNKKDTLSYDTHVTIFKNKLDEIEKDIVKPIEWACNTMDQQTQEYKQLLSEIHCITKDLSKMLEKVHAVLNKNRGCKSHIKLGTQLTSMKKNLIKDVRALRTNLIALHRKSVTYKAPFADKIGALTKQLNNALSDESESLGKLLQSLKHRLRCTDTLPKTA